jgi:hypothetical protein
MKEMPHNTIEIKITREAPMTTAKLKGNTIHIKIKEIGIKISTEAQRKLIKAKHN